MCPGPRPAGPARIPDPASDRTGFHAIAKRATIIAQHPAPHRLAVVREHDLHLGVPCPAFGGNDDPGVRRQRRSRRSEATTIPSFVQGVSNTLLPVAAGRVSPPSSAASVLVATCPAVIPASSTPVRTRAIFRERSHRGRPFPGTGPEPPACLGASTWPLCGPPESLW